MKQIEENIPLNSLYLDLTNDEKIENDKEVNSAEIIAMLCEILKTTESSLHSDMIDMLKKTEPFCNHVEEIDKALKKVHYNDKNMEIMFNQIDKLLKLSLQISFLLLTRYTQKPMICVRYSKHYIL